MSESRSATRGLSPEVFLCRASGEGSHNFRVCRDEAEVMAFYKEMWGEDHGGGIQSAIDHFRDADNWSNQGTAYSCELYCSTFEVWKVDQSEISLVSSAVQASDVPKIVCHAPGDRCLDCDHYRQKSKTCVYAPQSPASTVEAPDLPDMCESGWTPEQALRFYSEGRHFDVVDGRTRILDTGAVASDALKGLSPEYAASKGAPVSSIEASFPGETPRTDALDQEATRPEFQFDEEAFDRAIELCRSLERELGRAYATLATAAERASLVQSAIARADEPRDVLMGKSLREYTLRTFNELCSAWSDVRDPNGDINLAKCDYAAALEKRVRSAITELADLSAPQSAIQTSSPRMVDGFCTDRESCVADRDLLARAYALLWDGDCGPDGVSIATDIAKTLRQPHEMIIARADSEGGVQK